MSAGRITIIFFLASTLALLLIACQKRSSQQEFPNLLPYDLKIVVAGFNQPTSTMELITGQLPDKQGHVPADLLAQFDSKLRQTLETKTKRLYDHIPAMKKYGDREYMDSGSPMGLSAWVSYARAENKEDLLLVPQIINWRQRSGSEAGVTNAAYVRAEFYIIDLHTKRIVRQSVYDVEQVGLVDNLLTVGDFLKRKGRWVTAEQLVNEAIEKAIKDLGL